MINNSKDRKLPSFFQLIGLVYQFPYGILGPRYYIFIILLNRFRHDTLPHFCIYFKYYTGKYKNVTGLVISLLSLILSVF